MGFDGEGQPGEGLPLRGEDVVVVVERVRPYGRAVPEPPLGVGDGDDGEGQPQGLPLRGGGWGWVGERVPGRVPEPPLRCKVGDGRMGKGPTGEGSRLKGCAGMDVVVV